MTIHRLNIFAPVALLSLLLVGGGCGEADGTEGGDENAEQMVTSEDDHFSGHFLPDPDPPITGDNVVTIHLTDDGEPVTGADIDVEPWMPGHGHGSPEHPEVIEDNGEYVVSNIVYSMPGHWELRVDVAVDDLTDEFVVDYEVE